MTLLTGLDLAATGSLPRRLREARVGVLTHAAAVDRRGRPTLTVLSELGANICLVFAPEHGLEADAQAEEAVEASEVSEAALRVVSLYGKTRDDLVPKREHLAEIDLLVIDLADVGSRYYTYVWTALLAARAARDAGVHTIVLDRPNPISGDPRTLEGAPQREGFLSFVGLEPLPIRHALTIGEILALFFERDGSALGHEGALSIVPVAGWERHRTAQAWGRPFVMPSPNMPTVETALVYPGGCLVEGTNLSEGRGTTAPFQLVGAPFLDGRALADKLVQSGLPGALVRPVTFRPTFEKHAGVRCSGVMLHVTNAELFRPVATYLRMIAFARAQAPDAFEFRTSPYEFETTVPAFDLLTGSSAAREAIVTGTHPDDVAELVAPVDSAWADTVRESEARLERAQV
ncbi:MAG TPA: DUF1343 domain-containing protein [Polyangiaceae bacterium]|nr:DUF1343 domain-containing protein [Polyangiaceae bacterium]